MQIVSLTGTRTIGEEHKKKTTTDLKNVSLLGTRIIHVPYHADEEADAHPRRERRGFAAMFGRHH